MVPSYGCFWSDRLMFQALISLGFYGFLCSFGFSLGFWVSLGFVFFFVWVLSETQNFGLGLKTQPQITTLDRDTEYGGRRNIERRRPWSSRAGGVSPLFGERPFIFRAKPSDRETPTPTTRAAAQDRSRRPDGR